MDRQRLAALAQQAYKQKINLVCRVDSAKGPVVVKWFGWRRPGHYLLSPLFAGRAVTSWRIARTMSDLGVRTPEPLFVYSQRVRGLIRENIFICRAIHPHQTLRVYLQSNAPQADKLAAVIDLAGSIARLHTGGIIHRDLTTANFLVGDNAQVYIVDLNRARRLGRLSRQIRLEDLARLNFATGDDLETELTTAFFEEYGSGGDYDWIAAY
ncbi:MAG: lipopolysaccharide kinase InaA family protein, partial [Candidatus Neomarinimicrobiota bacterium]